MRQSDLIRHYAQSIRIVGLLFLALGAASCSKEKQDMNDPVFKAEIEKWTGLKFPQDAVWLGAELDRGQNYSFVACFRASREEVDKMLAPVTLVWSDKKRSVSNQSRPDISWFKPDAVKVFRSFQAQYPNPYSYLNVLVDDSASADEPQVVVFLFWIEP